jgi:acetate kinase
MGRAIVIVNAGSSSIKFSLFLERGDDLVPDVRGQMEGIYTFPRFTAKNPDGSLKTENSWPQGTQLGHDGSLEHIVAFLRTELVDDQLIGVGHRVVHGGQKYTQPVQVDSNILTELEKFIPLAPLHQPHNLTPIRRLLERVPDLPQVACFDTSFHRTTPPVAQMFALPKELTDDGIVRYGFHGLSYEYIASVLPQFDAKAAAGKTIVLHLGNGASMCAIDAGRSISSTMGFTAVEGLPMGTRCGSMDPGVILFLMDQRGMSIRDIEKLIYTQSGLLGVSGISSDMRALLASDDTKAKIAIDLYIYRIRRELGALAAVLGGLDAIVFTAGIGENSAIIRRRVCQDAAWIGVELDENKNTAGGPLISKKNSRMAAWVIPTNEELMIARHTLNLINKTKGA